MERDGLRALGPRYLLTRRGERRRHRRRPGALGGTSARITQRHLAILRSRRKPNCSYSASAPVWRYAPPLRRPLRGLLWVGLDDPTASPSYCIQRAIDGGSSDSLSPVLAGGEDASDPPRRTVRDTLVVLLLIFDVWQLGWCAELVPAHTLVLRVHQIPL